MNDDFDKFFKEFEERYPEKMAEARIWAKEFIAQWEENDKLVEVKNIDLEYHGIFICDEHNPSQICYEYCPICTEEN